MKRFFDFFHAQHPKELNAREWEMLLHVLYMIHPEEGWTYLSIEKIASMLNVSVHQASDIISSLEEKGYLCVYEQKGHSNIYAVPQLPHEKDPIHISPEIILHGLGWRLRSSSQRPNIATE